MSIKCTVIAILVSVLSNSIYAVEEEFIFNGIAFNWVNPVTDELELPPGLLHSTFVSTSMKEEVGYAIYLPPQYAENHDERFPVIYYLHGGRPGSETRSVMLSNYVHEAVRSGKTVPAIYVYVNGGILSHYNYAPFNSMGEDLFVKELIPYIDANYRTVADRSGRAIQGFSQGGRGTTRIMFKYPELFSSGAPGGPGYAIEKQIFENDGIEHDIRREDSIKYDFGIGNDAYTLAKEYAESERPRLEIAIWIGTRGFNYEATLEYLEFLDSLNIGYRVYSVGGVDHNPNALYEVIGTELMSFHSNAFDISEH